MRVSVWAPVVVFALFASPTAHAQMFGGFVADILQSQLGTVSAEADRITDGEELRGCELSYSVLVQDFDYRDGAFMSLDGSVVFTEIADGPPRLILKLMAEYIDSESGYGTPFAPGNVYLVRGSGTTRGMHIRSEQGEEPGTIVTEYDASETRDMVASSIRDGKLMLAFEREPFLPAPPFEIDPTVVETDYNGVRTHSDEARDLFLGCTDALLGGAEN